MVQDASLWSLIVPYGSVWFCMVPYGSIFVTMLQGSIQKTISLSYQGIFPRKYDLQEIKEYHGPYGLVLSHSVHYHPVWFFTLFKGQILLCISNCICKVFPNEHEKTCKIHGKLRTDQMSALFCIYLRNQSSDLYRI